MMTGGNRLDWTTDGRNWPHRSASRFLSAGGFDWHVQVSGPENAPVMLLLHGTGAASHSWRKMIPILGEHYRLVVPDLPCHGFTRTQRSSPDLSLSGMAKAVQALISALAVEPSVLVGHSAGAAIAVALAAASDRPASINHVIGINGAFLPIRGSRLLSPMAKVLFANPFSASMFSTLASVTPLGGNLLQATGSDIDREGRDIYRMLVSSPGHVRGALGMMATWDLSRFDHLLHQFAMPLTLIATRDDPMVPHSHSAHAAKRAPLGRLRLVERGGHLMHEVDAGTVCRLIVETVSQTRTEGADAA